MKTTLYPLKKREKLKVVCDVDMVFRGINPNQYAERYIFRKGEMLNGMILSVIKYYGVSLLNTLEMICL